MIRQLFLLLLILLLSFCNNNAQKDNHQQNYSSKDNVLKSEVNFLKPMILMDTILNISKSSNERNPSFIKKRLEQLFGRNLKKICQAKSIHYPPEYVLFRSFKLEHEFEIWAADNPKNKLKLLLTLPICAMDFNSGPKLEEGDGKTPEGFYTCKLLFGSSYNFMWIKLNNSEISYFGQVKYGSSFKICINYPNVFDKEQTRKIMKHTQSGSAICIHGNCVSAGCLSFKNVDFSPLFLLASYHNQKKYGKISLHIFPFRFNEKLKKKYANSYTKMTTKQLLDFWSKIEPVYQFFEKNHKALKINTNKNSYLFDNF